MAGVLGQLIRPQKRTVEHCTPQVDPKALELETAKEILAEVFGVRLSDVDEMILSRFEATGNGEIRNGEAGNEAIGNEAIGSEELWPQEFWLKE
jgi:hypothetical protein